MKTVLFRKMNNPQSNNKRVQIKTRTEDPQCKTHVRKSFVYFIKRIDHKPPELEAPEIFIRKTFDTKTKIEKFCFRVDGKFYMKHGGQAVEVSFKHTLSIRIQWKKKIFSPKTSDKLTP